MPARTIVATDNRAGKALTWIATLIASIAIWTNLEAFRGFVQGGILLFGALAAGAFLIWLVVHCFKDRRAAKENWLIYLIAIPFVLIGAANGAIVFGFFIPFFILPGLAFVVAGFLFGYLRLEEKKDAP